MLSASEAASHEEEEECLFYVALSRVEDHLSLSRALRYSERQQSNPSPALERIKTHLDRSITGAPTWTDRTAPQAADGTLPSLAVHTQTHDGRDIELYLDCPRRYLYQVVLSLSGSREDNGYVRFHRAVYRVLHWGNAQGTETEVTAIDLRRELEQHWVTIGPHDHPFTDLYKAAAYRILDQAAPRLQPGMQSGEDFEVRLGEHIIRVPIDQVDQRGAFPIIRRFRTGRAPQQPDRRELHALMEEAGRQAFGAGATFEVHYLTSDESVPISFESVRDRRLADCRVAIQGIEAGRFPPQPSDERCPRCPHYFICPTLPA
jgi:hypothetical protein